MAGGKNTGYFSKKQQFPREQKISKNTSSLSDTAQDALDKDFFLEKECFSTPTPPLPTSHGCLRSHPEQRRPKRGREGRLWQGFMGLQERGRDGGKDLIPLQAQSPCTRGGASSSSFLSLPLSFRPSCQAEIITKLFFLQTQPCLSPWLRGRAFSPCSTINRSPVHFPHI